MARPLSPPELRELHKAQILGDGGRVIFDPMLADRLVGAGLLAKQGDDPEEPTAAGRRRYLLTASGRAALDAARGDRTI